MRYSIRERESGPQHSVWRLAGSGRAQCTPRRNFAPISSSARKHYRASARTRGMAGVGGWVRTSCRDTQINTSCIKHTRSGKASALGVPREEVLGVKVLCAPGPAVQGRSARAPSPAMPQHLTLTTPCPMLLSFVALFLHRHQKLRNLTNGKQ